MIATGPGGSVAEVGHFSVQRAKRAAGQGATDRETYSLKSQPHQFSAEINIIIIAVSSSSS